MKFQPDRFDAPSVTAYGPGWLAINGERHEHSVMIGSSGLLQAWSCTRFEELSAAHFEALAAYRPELVLFGSGEKLRFPEPAWLAPLMHQRIGVETMDTAAACRTYNFLINEGRMVVAALLIERPSASASPA